MTPVVALDAMGVVYTAADDVAELLVPYLRELGCQLDDEAIEAIYTEGSLGRISSAELWERCGVAGNDAEYCSRHELTPGLGDLLTDLEAAGTRVAVLSNDVSEWSVLLRERFDLTSWISDWVISGDIGIRKPDPRAYEALVRTLGVPAAEIHFFDDRPRNVDAARTAGLQSYVFKGWTQVRATAGAY